jgi:hypothetical protein
MNVERAAFGNTQNDVEIISVGAAAVIILASYVRLTVNGCS